MIYRGSNSWINSVKSGKLTIVVLFPRSLGCNLKSSREDHKGGVRMSQSNSKEPSKAEVQTTKLNKMPIPGKFDPEFSAEEAAEVFEQQPDSTHRSVNEE